MTVHCLVPQYGDSWKPLAYDVRPPPARNRNMSTLWWQAGAKQVGEATAFIAPPLLFHARMSVFSIDSIDTVAQTFKASSYVELRLRAIANEADDKLVGLLLAVFGFSTTMVAMMNVVESRCATRRYGAASAPALTTRACTTTRSRCARTT